MSTTNKNEKIYSLAKKSTMVEAILTCNWVLALEFYGMSDKKRGFVTFGIGYRIFSIVINVLLLIATFGYNFLAIYLSLLGNNVYPDIFITIMKIVIGVICGLDIAYNIFFKIRYQIKVRNLMKEDENSIPMTHAFPQAYPPAYSEISAQMQKV
jgi:hypothetical protein